MRNFLTDIKPHGEFYESYIFPRITRQIRTKHRETNENSEVPMDNVKKSMKLFLTYSFQTRSCMTIFSSFFIYTLQIYPGKTEDRNAGMSQVKIACSFR